MTIRAIAPSEFRDAAAAAKMSPAILSGGHLFLTGVTGVDAAGRMPDAEEEQFRNVFDKIGRVLAEAGADFSALVEMTSYHVGLREHFELFDAVRLDYVSAPYPAWTAVEAGGLRRVGAVVEVRAVAAAPSA
ncbi:MAG: Rid family hydrolase [Pseudomonadota bacterium]